MKVTFVVGQALGHVGRALAVARALRSCRQSCEITFVGANPGKYFEKYISPERFDAVPIHGAAEPSPHAYASSLADILAKTRPDLLVYDLSPCPWLLLAGELPVPQVFLTNYFVTRMGDGLTAQDMTFEANKQYINAARQRLGLSSLGSVRELYEKDRVILADPPQLLPDPSALPAHYTLAGAIWWEPEGELPADLQAQRDILYVSLGSTGAHIPRATMARMAVSLDASRVIVTSTTRPPDDTFVSVPVSYYTNLPGSKVLDRSILAITQGGAGSCYQALRARVPLGIAPVHRNHYLLGKRLTELGLAFLLEVNTVETALREFLKDRPAVMERLHRFRDMDSGVASLAAAAAIGALC